MMTFRTLLAASVSAAVFAAGAHAQTRAPGHFNIGYASVDAEGARFDTIVLRGGWDFNDFLGAELEGLAGFNTQDIGGVDVDLNYGVGAFGRATLPLDFLDLYARAGYAYFSGEASAPGVVFDGSEDGFAYGVGAEFRFNELNGVRADFTRYDFGHSNADALSITYVRRFGGGW